MTDGTAAVVTWHEDNVQNFCVNGTLNLYPDKGCDDPGMTPAMIRYLLEEMHLNPKVVSTLPYLDPQWSSDKKQDLLENGIDVMMELVLNQSALTTTMFFGQRPERVPKYMWSFPIKWSQDGFILRTGGIGLEKSATALFAVFDVSVYWAFLVVLLTTFAIVFLTRVCIVRTTHELKRPHRALSNSFFHATTGDAIDDDHYEYETLPISHKLALVVSGMLAVIMMPIYEGFLLVEMSKISSSVPFRDGFGLADTIRDKGLRLLTDPQSTTRKKLYKEVSSPLT